MRVLDRLMDRTRRWATSGSRKAEHLAAGAEREEFAALAGRRPDWLSGAERDFVSAGNRAYRRTTFTKYAAVAALALFAIGSASAALTAMKALQTVAEARNEIIKQYSAADQARQEAVEQGHQAQIKQALFLASLEADPGTAMLLALEALPDAAAGVARRYVPEAELQLDGAWRALRERLVLKGHFTAIYGARRSAPTASASSPRLRTRRRGCGTPRAASRLASRSRAIRICVERGVQPRRQAHRHRVVDKTVRLWDAESGKQIGDPLTGHTDGVYERGVQPRRQAHRHRRLRTRRRGCGTPRPASRSASRCRAIRQLY